MHVADIKSCADIIRRALSNHHVMRRDELLLALPCDIAEVDAALNEMIRRGEVETLRPVFEQTTGPCFYRLIRDTDDQYEADQKRCMLPRNKLFDMFEMEPA